MFFVPGKQIMLKYDLFISRTVQALFGDHVCPELYRTHTRRPRGARAAGSRSAVPALWASDLGEAEAWILFLLPDGSSPSGARRPHVAPRGLPRQRVLARVRAVGGLGKGAQLLPRDAVALPSCCRRDLYDVTLHPALSTPRRLQPTTAP